MKNKIASIFLLSVGSLVFAASQPNQYTCQGQDVEVSYTTSSIAGKPTLSVRVGNEQARSYLGDQISKQDSVMGDLVTITKQAVPDLKVDTDTLVVPAINLPPGRGPQAQDVTFETVLIQTTSRTSIAGPALVRGQVQSSKYLPVTCTASSVVF